MVISIVSVTNYRELLKLHMDPWEIHFPDRENARNVITSLADYLVGANNTHNLINPPFQIYIEGWSTVYLCGLPVYNINFYREQKLDFTSAFNWIGRNIFGGVSSLFDQNNFSNYLGSLGTIALSSNGTILEQIIPEALEEEKTKITDFHLTVDEQGLALNVKGKFLKEQKAVFDLGTMTLLVKLNGHVLAKVSVIGLTTSKEDLTFDLKILVEPQIEGDVQGIKAALDAIGSGELGGVTAGIQNISFNVPNNPNLQWLNDIISGINV